MLGSIFPTTSTRDHINTTMSEPTTEPTEDAAPEIVSAFPLPPAFFSLYRDGADAGPPPPAPMEPQYHMFGTPFSTQDVVPDLLPLPGQKLYLRDPNIDSSPTSGGEDAAGDADAVAAADDATKKDEGPRPSGGAATDGSASAIDFKRQMKTINHSLLANFMELVDVLIKQPALFNEKLADLELLFLNMHNLINAFRPHQARETIIHMLQQQIQERRDAAHEIRKTIDDARRTVEDVHGELHDHAFDEMRSQDVADIKMEETEDDVSSVSVGGASSGSGSAASLTSAGGTPLQGVLQSGDLSTKAQEVQEMQAGFFSALQSIASVTQ